jgi:ankyrin repeat protein
MMVSYLLKLGADPNLGPGMGPGVGHPLAHRLVRNSGSIVRAAAQYGTLESLNLLVAHGAVVNRISAIHAAVAGGKVEIMTRLLELGVNVDEGDSLFTMGDECFVTPLLRAIHRGNVGAAKLLLENGAGTTIKGNPMRGGETAIELVKGDWVNEEIRKLVEEVGERGRTEEPEVIMNEEVKKLLEEGHYRWW